ncbi:hypothetical protein ES705_38090 [subsurface metagenome]
MKFGVGGTTQRGEYEIIEVKAGSDRAAFEKAEEAEPGFRPEGIVYKHYYP